MNLTSTGLPKHSDGDNCPSCHERFGGKLRLVLIKNSKKDDKSIRFRLNCSRNPGCKYKISQEQTRENNLHYNQKLHLAITIDKFYAERIKNVYNEIKKPTWKKYKEYRNEKFWEWKKYFGLKVKYWYRSKEFKKIPRYDEWAKQLNNKITI